MRELVTTALELLGAASIVLGAFLVWVPAGFLVLGALLIVAGVLGAGR